jgi:hypothetical protein
MVAFKLKKQKEKLNCAALKNTCSSAFRFLIKAEMHKNIDKGLV